VCAYRRGGKKAPRGNGSYDEVLEERVDWVRGIKDITSEGRRDRAMRRFMKFLKYERPEKAKEQLSLYKRRGFTINDIMNLQYRFAEWRKQPKRKKGKQGRRVSRHDGRLRTELVGLVATKPRRPI